MWDGNTSGLWGSPGCHLGYWSYHCESNSRLLCPRMAAAIMFVMVAMIAMIAIIPMIHMVSIGDTIRLGYLTLREDIRLTAM